MTSRFLSMAAALLLFVGLTDVAVAQRAASPRGEAATQIGADGPWIVVDYGRPILRGRQGIFNNADGYGKGLYAGAPVWRAGANVSTTLTTEAMLMIGGKMINPGTYTLFVEFSGDNNWTLIVSNHKAKPSYQGDGEGLWGAYNYTADKDVVRVPMTVSKGSMSVDQFTIMFADVSAQGGKIVMAWDDQMATAPFMVH